MSVVNVPPDGRIYGMGPINGTIHIYDTNNPPGANTTYDVTIIGAGVWVNQLIAAGHTDDYPGDGTPVYVCNHGPSKLQVLFLPVGESELTPADAGWSVEERMPVPAGA